MGAYILPSSGQEKGPGVTDRVPDRVTVELLRGAAAEAALPALAEVLADCVQGGASVSFMLPFDAAAALRWWRGLLPAIERGEILLLAARDAAGLIAGTAQLHLRTPPNQPHRAEVAKLLVRRGARNQGLAEALMRRLEAEARAAGRSLLTLDTASQAAERLYRRLGYQEAGRIPGYALLPHGPPCDTVLFYKQLG